MRAVPDREKTDNSRSDPMDRGPDSVTDDGYAIWERVFEPADMVRVLDAVRRAAVDRTKAGARHVLKVPTIRELAIDARLINLARLFVGADAVPFRATLFDKSPAANWLVAWHQDTAVPLRRRIDDPDWGPWSMKAGVLYSHAPSHALERVVALRVSLDDSTITNGPLRVLPNTHRQGVLDEQEIAGLARTIVPVDCIALTGAVVGMRPLTIHASSKAIDDQPRRVLHIEYAASLAIAPGAELAAV